MRKTFIPLLFAAVFLVFAFISGTAVSREVSVDLSGHMAVFSSGFDELKHMIADILYLQLDEYHHIMMYQGYDWRVVTDYLPHIWLITKLNPERPSSYIDGGYHLAVNLDMVDQGIELLQAGIHNCPDNPDVAWEYAFVCWEVEYGSIRNRQENIWHLLELYRRLDLLADDMICYNKAMNANTVLSLLFENDSSRRNNMAISIHYERQRELMRQIRRFTTELYPTES